MPHKNKTVVKSMQLLNLFLTNDRLTLNQMVHLSMLPKTSVFRMISSLEEMGFVSKDEAGGYALGLTFLQFGRLVAERCDIRRIAFPLMYQLRNEIGEAVNLIIRDGHEAIYIEKVDTTQPVRVYTQIGRRAPMYAGACPRILLAFLPEAEREEYLSQIELKPIASGTVTQLEQLQSILIHTRHEGYSISHSELEDDSSAVAAPIFNDRGTAVAGLSVAGPTSRFQQEHLPILISKVRETAGAISSQLGWRGSQLA